MFKRPSDGSIAVTIEKRGDKWDGCCQPEFIDTDANIPGSGATPVIISRHPNWVEVLDIRAKIVALRKHILTIEEIKIKPDGRKGFEGCHSKIALENYISANAGATYEMLGAPEESIRAISAYEAEPRIHMPNGDVYVKVNNYGKSSFFPDSWSEAKIFDETEYAIENNRGRIPERPNGNEYYGFSKDGNTEIHFYLNNDGRIISFFPKNSSIMKYSFSIYSFIDERDGKQKSVPSLKIENQYKYGDFFLDEIYNLSLNLDYLNKIVYDLERLISKKSEGEIDFGYEIYCIKCSNEKCEVTNVYEDNKIEAIIPTIEIYHLMKDWRDYLIKYQEEHHFGS